MSPIACWKCVIPVVLEFSMQHLTLIISHLVTGCTLALSRPVQTVSASVHQRVTLLLDCPHLLLHQGQRGMGQFPVFALCFPTVMSCKSVNEYQNNVISMAI